MSLKENRKSRFTGAMALLLAVLFAVSCFAGCGSGDEEETGSTGTSATEAGSEAETDNEIALTKQELGKVDWDGKDFNMLVFENFKEEVAAEEEAAGDEGTSSQVINDAVYERNALLEQECHLKFNWVLKEGGQMMTEINKQSIAPTGEFYLIDHQLAGTTQAATTGYLRDFVGMGVDLDKPWWDSGTADFALNKQVFFMCGDVNFIDDNFTYVLIFNKKMRETYANTIPDPYQTVRDKEWTLEYFNQKIQGISANSNGDGTWDENDTYGFVTTWEYGNTFFIGSDLRYVINDRTMDRPKLGLEDDMDKALKVLETAKAIFHANNATYMSPPGQEQKGLSCFKAGRGLFYSEVITYLPTLNKEMDDGMYGVLPVPKYDKAQEFYRTWTHESGSCLSIISSVPNDDAETIGKIIQYYAIFSAEEVRPAYYDVMLTSRNVQDSESGEMLDLILSNRVFDMGFYFRDFGFYELFKTDVYQENSNRFFSSYRSPSNSFERKVTRLLTELEKKKKS